MPMPSKRRARAPTINIDTSAADSSDDVALGPVSPTAASPQSESGTHHHRASSSQHLAVAPSTITSPDNFLSVPTGPVSRSASFDSAGETVFPASTIGSEAAHSPTPFPHTSDASHDLLNERDALTPDPGTENDFIVEDNKFAFSPGQLSKLIHPKNLAAFKALGGPHGFEKGLRTDLKAGLSADETYLDGQVTFEEATLPNNEMQPKGAAAAAPSATPQATQQPSANKTGTSSAPKQFQDRLRIFKDNRLPARKPKSIFQLMWQAYQDKILILLSFAAIVSLAVGIYQSQADDHGVGTEWIEGVAIIIAIFVVVLVGALNDYQKERQFVKLNAKKDDRSVRVVRSGRVQELSVFDLLVGDVVLMETGDAIPVDGIFLEGHDLKCDESSATGESDLIRKTPAAEVWHAIEEGRSLKKMDPFVLSGAKVSEGVGRFVVTAVGVNSSFGKTMMALREDSEVTPLQMKLNVIAEYIAKIGGAAVLLYFTVAFIEFLVRITAGSEKFQTPAEKGQDFLQIFIISVSVIVVAVPEGLPLAVTLALAFATTRMLKDNNLVRLLRSCETMGNATQICSDKTGTLTQNRMTLVAGTLGTSSRFGDKTPSSLAQDEEDPKSAKSGRSAADSLEDDVSPSEFVSTLNQNVKDLLVDSFVLNSTAFEGEEDGRPAFIGSKTETALLDFARNYLAMGPVSEHRASAEVAQLIPFASSRKCMGVVIKKSETSYRMFVKGASEILLSKCSMIVNDPASGTQVSSLSPEQRSVLQNTISVYASRSLRTIGLTYRDFESWPPKGAKSLADDPSQVDFDAIHNDMNFLGVVGIQDPLRPGVAKAVDDCKRAGVFVRMVTGDNVQTAKAIATDCGIYTAGGLIMEGPEFRKLRGYELDEALKRLQVLARSSPDDKRKLVKRLKELGETVAVTGDGTNDAPALKLADVGFSMGIAGTEVAKEASAIILMDDNFGSIVKALMWGRAVNDAVKKFLQFQLTVNVAAVIITFVSGIAASTGRPVLTAVQLLWVNLIMDTLAALALATDPPLPSILDRKPDRKSASLISVTMWKMIFGQAIYQMVVIFVFYFAGARILSYQSEQEKDQLQTMLFNMFVWMQIFNAFNNRRLDNHFNIFEGITKNFFFIGVLLFMIGGQVLIAFVGGQAFSVVRMRPAQWGYSIVLGALTIPVGMAIRLVPDSLILACIPDYFKKRAERKKAQQDAEHQPYQWNSGITEVRNELMFLKKIKGGRLNQIKFAVAHPREYGILPPRLSSANRSRSSTLSHPMSTGPEGSTGNESSEQPRSSTQIDSRPSTHRRGRSRSASAFGPAAVAAGIVAGSIAGWSPIERPHGEDD